MNRKRIAFSVVVATLVAVSNSANAQVIAQWGELSGDPGSPSDVNIVTATQNFLDPADYTTFVPSTMVNPVQGADYYPNNTGRTPLFNIAASEDINGRRAVFQPGNAANPDQIQAQVSGASTSEQYSGMIVFEDLLEGSSDPLLSLTQYRYRFGNNFVEGSSRFLFQDNAGEWFASEPSGSIPGGFAGYTIDNAPAADWFAFTPFGTGGNAAGEATIASTASTGIDFTNVQSVGVYFDITKDVSGGPSGIGFSLGYFQAALGVAAGDGDWNDDGNVDGTDFLGWQRDDPTEIPNWAANYGTVAASSASIAAVPEPTTVMTALLLAIAGGCLRYDRNH